MRNGELRRLAIAGVVALALGSCGSDVTSDQQVEVSVPVETAVDEVVDAGTSAQEPPSTATVKLSAPDFCDPIEDAVDAWAAAPIVAEHNAIYAEAPEPNLLCKWVVEGVDRSITVSYLGVPDSFFRNLVDGKQDRGDVVAPNFHDKTKFWVIAPNGWGVVVGNVGADASEDLDPMVEIANVALAQFGG
jgi:hypothetical protein